MLSAISLLRWGNDMATVTTADALVTLRKQQMATRVARCVCGEERPSAYGLPGYEFKGEGSVSAEFCKYCGYSWECHKSKELGVPFLQLHVCDAFVARGPALTDIWTCGCARTTWD